MALVPTMIMDQADTAPDAIAAVSATESLTYRQLVDRARRLAGALRRAGGGRNQVVGLGCERGLDGLTALLGILLSGQSYVYLDPTWPVERIRYLAAQCRLNLVLTGAEAGGAPVEPVVVTPDDLCYVVYTSGSTGAPKGVAVTQGGVAAMARSLAEAFTVTAGTRVLQFSSWAWDAAAGEMLTTLAAGGTLVLAGAAARSGGEALATLLREERVQVATLTPSVLAALPEADLPDLHTVVAVGEPCPPGLVARWAPGRRFLNGYGPSEATVAVSVGRCQPGEEVTIGRPLPGVRVRVVDPAGAPVAPGQPGELLVGGVGVARGYVTTPAPGDPGPGPVIGPGDRFWRVNGVGWYRTGDLVRPRADGHLVHLGRIDAQVKIRGHRVELAEVESGLRRHPGVRVCAVVPVGGRLVAYLVPEGPELSTVEVRTEAARWLPEYLLPAELHVVDALPLTESGKLDLRSLGRAQSTVDPFVTDVLALIRQALETDEAGPDDDVFDLGGHSLVAAQLAVAATERFGVPVAALQVYDHPTATRLAALITQLRPSGVS